MHFVLMDLKYIQKNKYLSNHFFENGLIYRKHIKYFHQFLFLSLMEENVG